MEGSGFESFAELFRGKLAEDVVGRVGNALFGDGGEVNRDREWGKDLGCRILGFFSE